MPDEIIVVDDASIETYEDILGDYSSIIGYPPLKLIVQTENQGQAAARNRGIKECSGDWIACLDHDDIWAPDHLAQLEQKAKTNKCDLVFCPANLFSESIDNIIGIATPVTKEEKNMDPFSLLKNCYIITSSCLFKKSSIESMGAFDDHANLRGVEDLDLFLRMIKSDQKIEMADKPTLFYRKHSESTTCVIARMIRQKCFVTDKHICWVSGPDSEKNRYRTMLFWDAAVQTSLAATTDKWEWLKKALKVNLKSPYNIPISIARYLKKTYLSKIIP